MGIFRRLTTLTAETEPFIIQVTIPNGGANFTLPVTQVVTPTQTYNPNISVSWGDSSSSVITSATDVDRIHTYTNTTGNPITRTITITGFMPGFEVNNSTATRSYITAIVDFGRVGLRKLNFYGCTNITSIPASGTMVVGYEGLDTMLNFSDFMRGTKITSIPSDIFQYAVDATNFTNAFYLTPLTSVSSNIFQYNTAATTFESCFGACTSLTSVISTLFDTNVNVISFNTTFFNCTKLTSTLTFANNLNVLTFAGVYKMTTTSNLMDGNAPEIWLRSPQPVGTEAFRNCLGLDNYASIPANFK